MNDCIDVTILAPQDCDQRLVQELLEVGNYLSNRVRNLVHVECRLPEHAADNQEIRIAVDGWLIHEQTLTGLVDFLHLQAINHLAA